MLTLFIYILGGLAVQFIVPELGLNISQSYTVCYVFGGIIGGIGIIISCNTNK